jgi:hypothetical protein
MQCTHVLVDDVLCADFTPKNAAADYPFVREVLCSVFAASSTYEYESESVSDSVRPRRGHHQPLAVTDLFDAMATSRYERSHGFDGATWEAKHTTRQLRSLRGSRIELRNCADLSPDMLNVNSN